MSATPGFEEAWRVCRDNILAFCELINAKPSTQQKEILQYAQDLTLCDHPEVNKRIVAKSGQGLGKTWCLAIIGLWRTLRWEGTQTAVIAPSDAQCRTVFFGELRRVVSMAPQFLQDMLEITATQCIIGKQPEWKIFGRTASTPESAAGVHHEHLTVLMEEFSGLRPDIVETWTGTCSQLDNLIVAIGNPTSRESPLGAAFGTTAGAQKAWPYRFTLSKLELSKERPEIAHPGKIEIARLEKGEDSDYWRVRIMGEFPLGSGTNILSHADVSRAMEQPAHLAITESPTPFHRVIGIDFARFGGDESAIMCRQGHAIVESWVGQAEPYDVVYRAFRMQAALGWRDDDCWFVPDAVGIGQGMLVHFDREGKQYLPFGSHYSSPDPEYADLQSYAWFRARAGLRSQLCSIPDDEEEDGLLFQLSHRVYEMDAKNRIKVESKKQYRQRLMCGSPDRADAFIQTFAVDDELFGGSADAIITKESRGTGDSNSVWSFNDLGIRD